MSKVCIGDIIQRVKNKANKDETELEYYVGGEHFDSGEVTVTRYGKIAGSTIGPAFNTCFEKGDVLLMSRMKAFYCKSSSRLSIKVMPFGSSRKQTNAVQLISF